MKTPPSARAGVDLMGLPSRCLPQFPSPAHMFVPRLLHQAVGSTVVSRVPYLSSSPALSSAGWGEIRKDKNYSKMDLQIIVERIPKFGIWAGRGMG